MHYPVIHELRSRQWCWFLVMVVILSFHPQLECLLTERQQISLGGSKHRGKATEQNNNNSEYSDG